MSQLQITGRFADSDGPRVRQRLTENLGGLEGLGGNFEEGRWAVNQIASGAFMTREQLERILIQLRIMREAAREETSIDAFESQAPTTQIHQWIELRKQHVDRIDEVIEATAALYSQVEAAENLLDAVRTLSVKEET